MRVSLKLIDVDTDKAYFENPKFLELSEYSNYYELLHVISEALSGDDVATIQVDPGSHYLLVRAEDRVLAFDLTQRHALTLGGKLKNVWLRTRGLHGL